MSAPRTSREALIAEALGDVGRLIDQAQALVPLMDEARRALIDAHGQLLHESAEQRRVFEQQVGQLSERAQTQVVTYIVTRADEAYRRKVQEQAREIRETLRTLLAAEVELAAQRAVTAAPPRRRGPRYELWLTQLALAAGASTVTWICTSIVR